MKIITRILTTAAFLAVPVLSHAQTQGFAMQSSRIELSPAALGMGGAGLLSTSSIAWGSYGNIAALPFSDLKGDAQVSYNNWGPSSTSYYSGAAGFNFKNKIGLSAGFSAGSGKAFEMFDDNGNTQGEFAPRNMRGNLGFSWRFIKWMSIGANISYHSETLLEGSSRKQIMSDVFLMGEFNGIRVSAGVRKIGETVADSKENIFSPASSAVAAIGYAKDFGKNRIEAEADMDYFFSGGVTEASAPFSVSVGAAYTYNDMVAVRGGYHTGGVIGNFASLGLGLKFYGVRLDAAFLLAGSGSPMNKTLGVGLGYCF